MLNPAHLLGASLLLSGCLSPGESRLPGGTYQLQPAAAAPQQDTWEEIEVRHPKGHGKFLAHVLNTHEKTRLTILDSVSLATLLSCTYEAGTLTRTGLIPPKDIPDDLPLALLQIAAWPADSVKIGLTGRLGLRTTDRNRVLTEGDEPLALIEEIPPGTRRIRLPRYETTISIRPASSHE